MFRKNELHIETQRDYPALAQIANRTTREIVTAYPKTARLFESLLGDPRVMAQWDLANYMAVVKLGYNDHGPIRSACDGAVGPGQLYGRGQVRLQ